MRKLHVLALAGAVVFAFAFFGGQAFAGGTGEKGAMGAKTIKVGLSWNEKIQSLQSAWQDEMQRYGKTVGQKNGVQIQWTINVANGDPATQASNIQDLINQHVDVIVARPEDAAAIGSSIDAAHKAGIPFITFDRASSTVQPDAHVGADSFSQGLTTGNAFADLLQKNGVQGKCIELMGDLRDMNAVYRSQAWHQVENNRHVWTTVVQVPTEWKPENFYTGTANALAAHPEANCIFVSSYFAFDGVVKALKEANKLFPTGTPGHIWIAAQDVNPQGLDALLKGYIDVCTTYDAYAQADALVTTMVDLLAGQKVQGVHLVPGRVATAANIKDMKDLWAKDYHD
ncbi:MAG: sugar ABC transporter substrate-binding protein [Spirochaetia bacterium]